MSTIIRGRMKIHGHINAIVFQVGTNVGPVYMSFQETTCMDKRSFAIVDAEKFVALWRADPYPLHKEMANGTLESWRKDYKFHYAEDGFSKGISNPVPLAEINFEANVAYSSIWSKLTKTNNTLGHVSFTNGITRTIWLLCHGAKSFPVEVSGNKAGGLSNAAGYQDAQATNINGVFSFQPE